MKSTVNAVSRGLPEVSVPILRVSGIEKAFYTAGAVAIFIWATQVRLYGVRADSTADPLYLVNAALGASGGSIMSLGVLPIILAKFFAQIGLGRRFDASFKDQRQLFNAYAKLLSVIFTVVCAVLYSVACAPQSVFAGAAIALQLTGAGLVTTLLDELLAAGYGFTGGAKLFVATAACSTVASGLFSPAAAGAVVAGEAGAAEVQGAVWAFFSLLASRSNKLEALREALFFRGRGLPSLANAAATIALAAGVSYLQGCRVEIPVRGGVRGQKGVFPIKVLYTSSIPFLVLSAFLGVAYLASQALYFGVYGAFPLVEILGRWDGRGVPTGGLAFFFAPPSGAWDALIGNPFRTVFYAACVLSASAVLGKSWIGLAGAGPREVARQLRDQGLAILTLRESAGAAHLGRHIPLAATFGAVAVTAIAIFGDAFGVIGGGACEKSPGRPVVRVQRSKALLFFAAVVIGVTIIFDVFERVTRDLQSEGGFQGLMEQASAMARTS